jgi:hypothetical protein
MFFTRQVYNGYPIIPLHGSAAMRIQNSGTGMVMECSACEMRHNDVWIESEAKE